MQDLAKEQLTAGILKRLSHGHIVIVDTPSHNKDSIVIGWMNAYGGTSIAEVAFEQQLIDMIQNAIQADDQNLLERYMEKLAEHVLSLAAAHEDEGNKPWHLTHNILGKDVLAS